MEDYLFNCCSTAYDSSSSRRNHKSGVALLRLLEYAEISYGSLEKEENFTLVRRMLGRDNARGRRQLGRSKYH